MVQKCYLLVIVLFVFLGACSIPTYIPQNTVGSDTLQAARRIVYVRPDGNDQSRGTQGTPLATIRKALDIAQPGDVIKVAAGTYNENIKLRSRISLIGSGADVTTLTADGGNIMTAENVSDVTIEGFTLDGQDSAQHGLYIDCQGLRQWTNIRHPPTMVILRNNTFRNFMNHAITGQYTGITIDNNNILSVSGDGIHFFRVISKITNNDIWLADTGIYIQDFGSEVKYNSIRNIRSDGILCHHLNWVKLENNRIIEIGRNGILCQYGSPILQGNYIQACIANGIKCFGDENRMCRPKIRGNIIRQNHLHGILLDKYSLADIGRYDDFGNNSIYGNGKFAVYSEYPSQTLMAIGNWWGNAPPYPEQFYGSVDYNMALKENPEEFSGFGADPLEREKIAKSIGKSDLDTKKESDYVPGKKTKSLLSPPENNPRYALWIDASYLETIGITIGLKRNSESMPLGIGIEGTLMGYPYSDKYDVEVGGVLQYPVPHSDYTVRQEYLRGGLGVDGLIFLNTSRRSIYVGIGFYLKVYHNIAQSNVTGWKYTHYKGEEKVPAFSGGIEFHDRDPDKNPLCIYMGFNSVRGLVAGLGFSF